MDKSTGKTFAVKQATIEERSAEDRSFKDQLLTELRICKDLRDPHIVSFLGHDYVDGNLFIYLEYMAGGSVASCLQEFGAFDGDLLKKAVSGMLQGVNYLHTRSPPVVHRDIKGANLLADLSFNVKLADFGCSKRDDMTTSFTTVGSIPWMAPEVIQHKEGYGRKADIWSVGCTVIEMATAQKPWGKGAFDNILYAVRHIGMTENTPSIPDVMSEDGREFVALCVQRKVDARPSATELIEHGYLKVSRSDAREM
jgi:serine/threonine protein kinase